MGGVATSLTALGNGAQDGDIGYIRVSQGGEEFVLKLIWDSLAKNGVGAWVSKPIECITSTDQDWMHIGPASDDSDWSYWGGMAGVDSWWTNKAIPFAGALFAAGLKLQDRIQARTLASAISGHVVCVSPWFYEYDSGNQLIFSNDKGAQAGFTWNGHADLGFEPSPENIGHGAVLKNDGTTGFKFYDTGVYEDDITSSGYHGLVRNLGWDYVKFFLASQPSGSALGGVPTTTPYTPIKKFLYPTLYGKGAGGEGSAGLSWEVRWAS